MKKLSFIIVNFNNAQLTIECVESIRRYLGDSLTLQIIIVDNASRAEDFRRLQALQPATDTILIRSETNRGLGGGCNLGNQYVTGDYVLYLNNDTLFIDDSILLGIEMLETDASIGMIGAKLLHEDLSLNVSYGYFPFITSVLSDFLGRFSWSEASPATYPPKSAHKPFDIDFPAGAFMLLRRNDFMSLNGFDERFFMYFEETDMAFRLKREQKKRIVLHPQIRIIHKTGSTTKAQPEQNKIYFYKSWRLFLLKHTNYRILLCVKLIRWFHFFRIFIKCRIKGLNENAREAQIEMRLLTLHM